MTLDHHPTLNHVIIYFTEKGRTCTEARRFFSHYENLSWKNRNGTILRNWKKAAWEWIYYGETPNRR